jgi:hypothetical protein
MVLRSYSRPHRHRTKVAEQEHAVVSSVRQAARSHPPLPAPGRPARPPALRLGPHQRQPEPGGRCRATTPTGQARRPGRREVTSKLTTHPTAATGQPQRVQRPPVILGQTHPTHPTVAGPALRSSSSKHWSTTGHPAHPRRAVSIRNNRGARRGANWSLSVAPEPRGASISRMNYLVEGRMVT